MRVALYDKNNIDLFQWPETTEGKRGKDYLYPLIKEGVGSYLLNVATEVQLVTCNHIFLPITVNHKEYDNSYVASNYYALKFYEEKIGQKNPFLMKLQSPLLVLGGNIFKLFKINKTIFLNNWLFTNSLAPSISSHELEAIVAFLKNQYPDHILIFRHLESVLKQDLIDSAKVAKFQLLKTRDIYFYEPKKKETFLPEVRKTHRRDSRLLEKLGYEIMRNEELQEKDLPRLLELYEMIYLKKYTKYSPRYSVKFLKNALRHKVFNFVALKKNDRIDGFFAYFLFNQGMINTLFGYDLSLSYAREMYCLLMKLILDETEKHNVVINDGSGSEQAKINRGLSQHAEYMGIYHTHLPFPRRVLWDSITYFYRRFQKAL